MKKVLTIAAVVVVLAAGGWLAYAQTKDEPTQQTQNTQDNNTNSNGQNKLGLAENRVKVTLPSSWVEKSTGFCPRSVVSSYSENDVLDSKTITLKTMKESKYPLDVHICAARKTAFDNPKAWYENFTSNSIEGILANPRNSSKEETINGFNGFYLRTDQSQNESGEDYIDVEYTLMQQDLVLFTYARVYRYNNSYPETPTDTGNTFNADFTSYEEDIRSIIYSAMLEN